MHVGTQRDYKLVKYDAHSTTCMSQIRGPWHDGTNLPHQPPKGLVENVGPAPGLDGFMEIMTGDW